MCMSTLSLSLSCLSNRIHTYTPTPTHRVWCKQPEGSSPSAMGKIRWLGREDFNSTMQCATYSQGSLGAGNPLHRDAISGLFPHTAGPAGHKQPPDDAIWKEYRGPIFMYKSPWCTYASYHHRGDKSQCLAIWRFMFTYKHADTQRELHTESPVETSLNRKITNCLKQFLF